MNPIALLTTFDGRINRAKLWLGLLYILILSAILYAILYGLFGVSAMSAPYASGLTVVALATLFVTALIAWPASAVAVKRLRDRDRPLWLLAVFWAPTVVTILAQLTGIGFRTVEAPGQVVMVPDGLGWVITALSFVIGIWAIVELGFLKGTAGPNQHGPDPLAAKA